MNLFTKLVLETHNLCNRRCSTCLRQNYPNQVRPETWLHPHLLTKALVEAWEAGFRGPVCLQFFNEPLLDSRMPEFVRQAKRIGFSPVYFSTNGDFLTERLAADLDGVLDKLYISVYDGDVSRFRGLFEKTLVEYAGRHITTHYSPNRDLKQLIQANRGRPCLSPRERMIIRSDGRMALCCEDMAGEWPLGNIAEFTVKQLWFSPWHQKILEHLGYPGGRRGYEYCKYCPRA